eukprot:scaffold1386_cov342-Pavlova_lutheri.AAC.28
MGCGSTNGKFIKCNPNTALNLRRCLDLPVRIAELCRVACVVVDVTRRPKDPLAKQGHDGKLGPKANGLRIKARWMQLATHRESEAIPSAHGHLLNVDGDARRSY